MEMTRLAQPKGEFLADGRNWFSLGMIHLSDKGSCVSLQSPAGLPDGEGREALAMPCHGGRRVTALAPESSTDPGSCSLVKNQAIVDCQLLSDDASLKERCKKGETTK